LITSAAGKETATMTRQIGFALFVGCLLLSGAVHAALDDGQTAAKMPKQAAQRPAGVASPAPAAHAPVRPAVLRPHELTRDDPARARGKFDERARNPEREQAILRLHEHDFHVADVRHFREAEMSEWRGGHWRHALYDGRLGWYYEVGGVWYPYEAPILPYPTTVAPLVYDDDAPDAVSPPVAPLPALPHVAYHCASPQGFYPTLAACDTEWVAIAPH
jgi:hypothetical protein